MSYITKKKKNLLSVTHKQAPLYENCTIEINLRFQLFVQSSSGLKIMTYFILT